MYCKCRCTYTQINQPATSSSILPNMQVERTRFMKQDWNQVEHTRLKATRLLHSENFRTILHHRYRHFHIPGAHTAVPNDLILCTLLSTPKLGALRLNDRFYRVPLQTSWKTTISYQMVIIIVITNVSTSCKQDIKQDQSSSYGAQVKKVLANKPVVQLPHN